MVESFFHGGIFISSFISRFLPYSSTCDLLSLSSQLATAVYSRQGGFSPNAAESVYGEMNSRGQEVKVEFIDTSSKDPGRITNPIQRPGMSANLGELILHIYVCSSLCSVYIFIF